MNFFLGGLIYKGLYCGIFSTVLQPSRQEPASTFVQSATESAAQGSGPYHAKEVIDRRILVHRHRCETPSSSLQSSKYSFSG